MSRFCYNWALAEWSKKYLAGQRTSGMSLKKQFNAVYREQFPWVKDVHRDAHSQPFANLHRGMHNFFEKRSKYPTFKKKGRCRDSFYVSVDKFRVDGTVVVLPKIGRVKMTEGLRLFGVIKSATVSRSADRWFISIQVECEPKLKSKTGDARLGIDLGVKTSVTCSDGSIYQSSRPLNRKSKHLGRLQRSVSRKVKGSNNRYEAVRKLAKLYWRTQNVRTDFLHKTTTDIVRKSQAVCIEDLSIKGMLSNHKMAKAIAEQGLRKFRTILEYKCQMYNVDLHVVNRFYPSSRTCSACGLVKSLLKLSERVFTCEYCGLTIDRDFNASVNLMNCLPPARWEVKPVDQLRTLIPYRMSAEMKQEFRGKPNHVCPESSR